MPFSRWTDWNNRDNIPQINYPGVYIIAKTDKNITGKKFSLIKEIIYIGMTNSKGGLKARLKQFDNTIKGKLQHGGADRVRYKYPQYNKLISKLYTSVSYIDADTTNPKTGDWKKMGEVAKHEYVMIAKYLDKFRRLPEFNNKTTHKFSKHSSK